MDIVFTLVVILQILVVMYIGYNLRKTQEKESKLAAASRNDADRQLLKKKKRMRQAVELLLYATLLALIANHAQINALCSILAALTALASLCVAHQGRKMGDQALAASMLRAMLALAAMLLIAWFFA